MLGYEKFRAYQKAIEFLASAISILESLPERNGAIAEQFRRAALSIVLNIAEGSGKPKGRDRNKSYRIAIGSSMECGAVLDVLRLMKHISLEQLTIGKGLLNETVGILSAVCKQG